MQEFRKRISQKVFFFSLILNLDRWLSLQLCKERVNETIRGGVLLMTRLLLESQEFEDLWIYFGKSNENSKIKVIFIPVCFIKKKKSLEVTINI